jgi:hypothetical protein
MDFIPMYKLCKKLSSNTLLCVQLSKWQSWLWFKLYGICGRQENLLNLNVHEDEIGELTL